MTDELLAPILGSPAARQPDSVEGAPEAGSVKGGLPAVMSVAFGSFVLVSSEFLPIGLLPRISVAFGVSNGTAGIMITITGLVAAFSAPTLSIVSGRVDRRWMLFGLTTLLLASDLIVAAAPVFAVALAARILLGIAVGGFWTIGPSLAPRFVAPHAVPKAVAMITAGVSIGTIAGLPVGELIGHITSWRVAFMAGAALALVALALQLRYLPALPSSRSVKVADLVRLARTPVARIGLVASGMTVFANFAAYTFVTPYLEDNAHIGAGWVSLVLVGYGTTSIVGNFVAGSTITRSMTKTLLGSTLILVVSIGLLVVTTPWVALVVVLIGAWGLSWGATPVILQTWMMRAAPGAHEEGLSLFMFVVQLSIAGGSLGGGIVVDALGNLWTFGAGAVVAFLAGVVVLGMLRRASPAEHPFSWRRSGDELFGDSGAAGSAL